MVEIQLVVVVVVVVAVVVDYSYLRRVMAQRSWLYLYAHLVQLGLVLCLYQPCIWMISLTKE